MQEFEETEEKEEEEEEVEMEVESDHDSEWAPDPLAVENPKEYRVDTWQSTFLGIVSSQSLFEDRNICVFIPLKT